MTNQIITNDEPAELAELGNNMAFLNPADMPNLDEAEVGMSIEPKYFEFQVGKPVRVVYNGLGHITKKNEGGDGYTNIPAVVFQNKSGVFLHAGASLVNQLQNIPVGTAVQITFTGQEKTNGGFKVNKFDVRLLNVSRVNVPAMPTQPQITSRVSAPQVVTPEPVIEIVDPLHFWAVTEAAKFWNIEAGDAARQIAKAKLPKMSKQDFTDWLHDPQDKSFA